METAEKIGKCIEIDTPPVVVVLSGGLDSATVLGIVRHNYPADLVHAITFSYGQRHKVELKKAKQLAHDYWIHHKIINIKFLGEFGGSALTDKKLTVPTDGYDGGIPISYVPGRNNIFIAICLSYAETINARAIYLGVNAIDFSGYPDCRPEFIMKWNELSKLANKRGIEGNPIKILTPLMNMDKQAIVKKGIELGVPYEHTWSCYSGGRKCCGKCDSCRFRSEAFEKNDTNDPLLYDRLLDCE